MAQATRRITTGSIAITLVCIAVAVALVLAAMVAKAYTASATWYDLTGNTTACGDIMNAAELTAASRDYACGTQLQVSYGSNSVVVTVNDYGPAAWTGHDIDLSRGAADALGLTSAGVGMVDIEEVSASSASASSASASASASPASTETSQSRTNVRGETTNSYTPSPTSGVYVVKSGDWLCSGPQNIAANLGVSCGYLLRVNNLGYYDTIYPGDPIYY